MCVTDNLIKNFLSQARRNLMDRVLECFRIVFIMFVVTSVMEVLSSPSPLSESELVRLSTARQHLKTPKTK